MESISSCARKPPRETPTPELINVHTVRVLKAIEAQIRLLALPVEPFHHSPFTTCMVSEGTLALLSACTFLFKGQELAIARDQIRMTIGCLKALGELWPRTAKNVQEIQTIARHVLGLGGPKAAAGEPVAASEICSVLGSHGSKVSSLPSASDDQGDQGQQRGPESEADTAATTTNSDIDDVFASLGSMEEVCGWYNEGELEQDLSWWANNPA